MAKPYVTKDELSREIILSKKRFKESNYPRTPSECFTPKLTEYLQLMVNRYANKGQWRSYSYIDDMKSDAMVTLCQNCFKYDETRFDNPFGYLTQIIKYCFITFLEKEEIMRDIKDSLWESIGMTPSYARQIKNEMLRDVVDQSNKGMKALKKDAEIIGLKIEVISQISTKLSRGGIPDLDIDFEISEALEIEPHPYTSDLASVLLLFTTPPHYLVEEGVEIAGNRVNCLTVYDESTKSNTKRVLSDTEHQTVVLALCSIGLMVRRDLLVKRMRQISGYNIHTTRIPTAEVSEVQTELEPVLEYQEPRRKRKKMI